MSKQVYNRIFTKEKWEKVCKYNKELMEDYLLELKSNKKTDDTIKQYRNDLRIVFIYILEEFDNKPIYKLKKKHFRNYKLWMQEKGMSSSRINRLLAPLKGMLEYATNEEDYEDDIEINYASKVKGVQKEKTRDIVFLSDDEVDIIYTELMNKKKYSQALLCALMYDSAARRKEAYQIKRFDLSVDGKISESYVIGKRGKKYRPIYHDKTRLAYAHLIETIDEKEPNIWLTRNNKFASYESLYAWVVAWRKILEKSTGEYKEFNPHSFRHSALENYNDGTHYALRKTGRKLSLEKLQILANHSDISTTQSYLKDKSEDTLLDEFEI